MRRQMRRQASIFDLSMAAFRLGIDAQAVMGLRLAQLAAGRGSAREITRMVTEKAAALTGAQHAATLALATEGPFGATARVLGVYRRIVAANRRRLS